MHEKKRAKRARARRDMRREMFCGDSRLVACEGQRDDGSGGDGVAARSVLSGLAPDNAGKRGSEQPPRVMVARPRQRPSHIEHGEEAK